MKMCLPAWSEICLQRVRSQQIHPAHVDVGETPSDLSAPLFGVSYQDNKSSGVSFKTYIIFSPFSVTITRS